MKLNTIVIVSVLYSSVFVWFTFKPGKHDAQKTICGYVDVELIEN
jgi:hypothetical protein